jgi:inhibitor of the pro-sigma K processing machinery
VIFGLSYETLAAYIFIFIVVILFLAVLASPLKRILKILFNCTIGTLALLSFNFIGQYMNFTIGINPGSILTVGILGIPGFLLMIFLKYYLF